MSKWPTALLLSIHLFLPVPASGKSQKPYRCPLKRHNGFSSSFQDFRSSHFHGGVDLRTFQKTGFPVYAISDGEVVRLRMVRRGSGRGVYLQHRDGNTSLYFHLERFAPELEKILQSRQRREGKRYVGNVYIDPPIPISSGQLLGYSGETGAGFPHLHLEIRDSRGAKLDPFPLVDLGNSDKNSPRLTTLILRSAGKGMINGGIGEVRLPLVRAGDTYTTDAPLLVTGGIEAVIGGRDISDTGRPVAPWKVRADLDERRIFNLEFNRFTWEDNNQLGFVYDMRESSPGMFFFNLFAQPGYTLESSGIGLKRALADLDPGKYRLEVTWLDHFGNRSPAGIPIVKRRVPAIRIGTIQRRSGSLDVEISKLEVPEGDRVAFVLIDSGGKALSSRLLQPSDHVPGHLEFSDPGPAGALEIRWYVDETVYAVRRYGVGEGPAVSAGVKAAPWISGDSLLLTIAGRQWGQETMAVRPAVAGASWISPVATNEGLAFLLEGGLIDSASDSPDHRLALQFARIQQGKISSLEGETLRVLRLIPGRETRFQWSDFSARFWPRSVRAPRLMLAEQRNHPTRWPLLSSQVHLGPDHFAFLDKVDYSFIRKIKNPHQAAIFRWNPRVEKWGYVFTKWDSRKNMFTSRVRASGTYALMRDNEPPRIRFVRINGSSLPRITVTDQGSGVDDLSLSVELDGKKLDAEYDPDRKWVIFHHFPRLTPGIHRLSVEVRDRTRNRARRALSVKTAFSSGKSG